MTNLNPCPFCGADVKLELCNDVAIGMSCPTCGLEAAFPGKEGDAVVAKWNMRRYDMAAINTHIEEKIRAYHEEMMREAQGRFRLYGGVTG